MKSAFLLCFLMVALVTIGCGADSEATDGFVAGEAGAALEPAKQSGFSDSPSSPRPERLVIRNASLDLVVRDAQAALKQVNALADEVDGFVVTSQLNKVDRGVRANVTIRVPAESLDTVLEQLHDLALEVRRQSVTGQDVTEEYTDLQARLRHLDATDARLLNLMEEAEDTEATLAVFAELQRVQGEIEQVKGRIQYLEQSSALSTISIELIPDALAQPLSVAGWRPKEVLRSASQALIRTLQLVVDALIWGTIYVLPVVLLVFGLPIVFLRWLVRLQRRRRG